MHEALRAELLQMKAAATEARRRRAVERSAWDPEVDRRNVARLKEIIAEHGWPGKSLVGEDGAFAAWLIAQRAGCDPDFQARSLELIRSAAEAGEVETRLYAYLEDTVRRRQGKKQRYGTQFRYEADYLVVAEPLDAPEEVDALRRAVGLEPLRHYLTSALAGHFARRVLGLRETEIALTDAHASLIRASVRQGPVTTEFEIDWDAEKKECRVRRGAPAG